MRIDRREISDLRRRKEGRASHRSGFTLIELMIVVVILGLLATIIVPKILNRPEKARRVKAQVEIRAIQTALALFKTDTGRFPTTSEGLETLVTNPGIENYDSEGYLLYIGTTLVRGLPEDIYSYAESDPTFPDQSTADQFFDEKQFEAYRELGYQLTARAIRDLKEPGGEGEEGRAKSASQKKQSVYRELSGAPGE